MSLTSEQLTKLMRVASGGGSYRVLPAVLLIDSPVTQDGTDMQVANLPGRQARCDQAFAAMPSKIHKRMVVGDFIFVYLN